MRDFNKVGTFVWQAPKFQALSDNEQLLYLYMMTCQHVNMAGAFMLPEGYACADLRWEPDKFRECRTGLILANLIAFDEETNEIMVVDWFQHNPPMNAKHLTGATRLIHKLQSKTLQDLALKAIAAHTPPPATTQRFTAIGR